MRIIERIRTWLAPPNADYKTRLASGELNDLHHHVRNAVIGLRIERRKFVLAMGQAIAAHRAMGDHLARIEDAIKPKGRK